MFLNTDEFLKNYILKNIKNQMNKYATEGKEPSHVSMSSEIYDFLREHHGSSFSKDDKGNILFLGMLVGITKERDTVYVSLALREM